MVGFAGADHDWGAAAIEGADVMPVGDGVVLVDHGERSSARATSILAANLFNAGAGSAGHRRRMPRERAAMHLDTVFTFCDRTIATIDEPVVSGIVPIRYLPDGDGGVKAEVSDRPFLDEIKDALGPSELTVVATGGDEFEAERNQWDDGNNASPCRQVSSAYERNEAINFRLSKAGIEVHAISGQELRRGRGGGHCNDLSHRSIKPPDAP